MVITSDKIREMLNEIWPDLIFIVLSDQKWNLSTLQDAKDWNNRIEKQRFVQYMFECEEIAFHFMVTQRMIDSANYFKNFDHYNRPLGIAFASRIQNQHLDHVINIWFTDKGIFLLDRQNGIFWKPERTKDNIYIVIM